VVVPSVSLFPGDSAPIPIRIHPPRGKDTRPGNHAFVVRARSNADPTLIGKTKGVVVIGSFAVFHMELAPKRITGFRGNYKVTINNGANNDLQLALNAEDPDESLRFNLKPSEPTISPNSKVIVPMVVSTKAFRLVGAEEKFKFNVTAHPVEGTQEDDKLVQGEFVQKPIFKAWKWPLVILAALLLLLAFVLVKPDINPCSPTVFLFQGVPPQARFYYSLFCQANKGNGGPATSTPAATTAGTAVPDAQATDGIENQNPDYDKGIHRYPTAEPKYTSGAGFLEIRDSTNGSKIGAPRENEWPDVYGVSHQKTANGQLLYFLQQDDKASSGTPRIYFVENGGNVYSFQNCNPQRRFINCNMVELRQGP
jgi:hypothetical protein